MLPLCWHRLPVVSMHCSQRGSSGHNGAEAARYNKSEGNGVRERERERTSHSAETDDSQTYVFLPPVACSLTIELR